MKREERTIYNHLCRDVNGNTVRVEIPTAWTHEARQACHELLTIVKQMHAVGIYWDAIRGEYCLNYAPGHDQKQKSEDVDTITATFTPQPWTWTGYRKPDEPTTKAEKEGEKAMDTTTKSVTNATTATTETKGAATMNTTKPTTKATTTAAKQTFPRLLKEINVNYDCLTADTFHYIRLGWFPSWANEHHTDQDRGIKQYSTARRWEQYKAGEITREKAIELAERRAFNEIEKRRAEKISSLEAAANAPRISSASVTVEWTKSRTWGANPTAVLLNVGDGRTVGHASGCGYDKESAAIAEAMNASPAALRVLYELGEAALERGENPHSASACSGYHWGGCIGYGAGYSVLPYWEGGVGSSCFWDILKKAGYTVRHAGGGKMFDCYTFYVA